MDYFEIMQKEKDRDTAMEIAKSLKLYLDMQEERIRYEKLEHLAYIDYVDTVKKKVDYTPILFCVSGAKEHIDDKRVQKENYKYLCNYIRDNITGVDIEVDKITYYGFEEYAVGIYFKYKGDYFEFNVPDMSKINSDNFRFIHDGKLSLLVQDRDNDCIWNGIRTSYEKEELKQAFLEYIMPKYEVNK